MNRVYDSEFLGKNQGETISVAGWFFGRLGHANIVDIDSILTYDDQESLREAENDLIEGKTKKFNKLI